MPKQNYYAIGTDRQYLRKFAYIMELHYGEGLSYKVIAEGLGIPKSNVQHICDKYKSEKGKRDITITIQSAV
jgi:DNA-binding transcriptional regulator LsrR (DeoR family)